MLHLRGNVEGFLHSSSKHKYLRLITGRHDLPFYTRDCVELQRSFLDAFTKGVDNAGWSRDEPPKVGYTVRVGNVGFNDATAEAVYPTKYAADWPLPATEFIKYHLTSAGNLSESVDGCGTSTMSYKALGNLKNQQLVQFVSDVFQAPTEFTGPVMAHLSVSVTGEQNSAGQPSDMDIFLTLRHLDTDGHEILYTGTVGDPVPVTKGWLRVSMRKVDESRTKSRAWHPERQYLSTDRLALAPGIVYAVDVEIWPTNVVMSLGDRLVLEVSSGDTQGAGLFEHNSTLDRDYATFDGMNHINFGQDCENWLLMPKIPYVE